VILQFWETVRKEREYKNIYLEEFTKERKVFVKLNSMCFQKPTFKRSMTDKSVYSKAEYAA